MRVASSIQKMAISFLIGDLHSTVVFHCSSIQSHWSSLSVNLYGAVYSSTEASIGEFHLYYYYKHWKLIIITNICIIITTSIIILFQFVLERIRGHGGLSSSHCHPFPVFSFRLWWFPFMVLNNRSTLRGVSSNQDSIHISLIQLHSEAFPVNSSIIPDVKMHPSMNWIQMMALSPMVSM